MRPAAGLGFKPQHFEEAMASPAAGLWFEVHAENAMVAGGPRLAMLEALRERFPLSLHGVGLSLASADRPDPEHLAHFARLVTRFEPVLVSEHLAWSRWNGLSVPDLLPFPRTIEALRAVARNVEIAQEALSRRLLIENPSLYLALDGHEMSETDFLRELVSRTGCRLLIDVNNVFVSSRNLGFDARAYLDALPAGAVGEIHVAGHAADPSGLLIDTHGAPVADPVWELAAHLLRRTGPLPVLVERDDDIPAFDVLMAERAQAQALLTREGAHV